jgi:predicted  nucleic acid-binding Zn-ribbon protein
MEVLKEDLDAFKRQKVEQSQFISKLNREKQDLKNELDTKEKKIATMRQEARERELKLENEVYKLQHRIAGDGKDENVEERLRSQLRDQSKTIFDLQQTLEVL